MTKLEPGRKRRHRMTPLARGLWGVAIGFALAATVMLIVQ